MAKYIGPRVIPYYEGEWNAGRDYEALSLVYYAKSGNSYIAKKDVPVGTPITDTTYWGLSAEFSAQLSLVLRQLDNIIANAGDTGDNAELIDIRVGYDGTTYPTAGDSVRGQATLLLAENEKSKAMPEFDISSFGGGTWLEKQACDTTGVSIATYAKDDRCTSSAYLTLEVGKAYDFIDYGGATFKLYFADEDMVYQGADTDIRCTDFRTTVTPQFKYCRVMYYSGDASLAAQLRVSDYYAVNHKIAEMSEKLEGTLSEKVEELKNMPEFEISTFNGGAWLEQQGVDSTGVSLATYPVDNRCTSANYLELEIGKSYDFIDYGGAGLKLYFADDNVVYQGADTDIRCTDFRTTVTPQFKYCRVMYYSGDVSLAGQLRVSEHYEINHKLDALAEQMEGMASPSIEDMSAYGGGAWLEQQGVDSTGVSLATYSAENRCTSVNYLELEIGKAYDFIDYGGAGLKLYFADDNVVYQGADTDIRCTEFRTTVTPQYKYCRVMYYSGDVSLAEKLRISDYSEINHMDDERMKHLIGEGKKITVGASGDYTKLTDALAYAYSVGDVEIYVESGTYDIISELGTLSGTGPVIGNNTKIVFNPKAFVTCEYEGGDAEIEKNFAPLNAGVGDFEIYGLQITCKNVRYCVHDERNSDEQYYSHIYERCRMTLDNTASSWNNHQCIGGGLGKWGDITIRDCQFESAGATAEKGIVTWHNTTDYMARGRIVVTGCYFHGDNATFSLGCYGDTTYVTRALVSNNSFGVAPFVEYEDPDAYTNLNMAISAWNNEIRSSATSTGDGITLTDDGEGNVTIS